MYMTNNIDCPRIWVFIKIEVKIRLNNFVIIETIMVFVLKIKLPRIPSGPGALLGFNLFTAVNVSFPVILEFSISMCSELA